MSTPTVTLALSEFIFACKADGLADTTIDWYSGILSAFAERFNGLNIEQFRANDLRVYLAELRATDGKSYGRGRKQHTSRKPAAETVRSYHRALNRFFNWCMREYDLDPATNPMLKIAKPRSPKREPKAVSLDDLFKLLEATDKDIKGIRDRAMIAFLADTGCRAGGMLSLKIENLDMGRVANGQVINRAIVTEKGEKTRVAPFGEGVANLIRAWLDVRPVEATTVFCSLGTNHFAKPLTISGLHRTLLKLKEKAGVTGRVNPHSFRHGFAREYLRNGGDLATLAQLMGHSNVMVTAAFYAVYTADELARQHDKYSPLRNVGKESPD